MSADIYAESPRRNSLKTTNCPDAYAYFEINGNTVKAAGTYKKDRLRRISADKNELTAMKFSGDKEGNFEAEFELEARSGYSNIVLQFESGAVLRYLIRCDGQRWYFPDNGLPEKNRRVFDNIIEIPPAVVRYYYTPDTDPERAAETQAQVKRISDMATEGIEDDYEKARALCRYVAANIYYDHDARVESVSETTVALENVIAGSRTVCIGFASYYCALLQAQGIKSVTVIGSATSDEVPYEGLSEGPKNHQFTAFWYEKEQRWVWADPCWCGAGDYRDGVYTGRIPHEKFFDITDEALSLYHRADYATYVDYMIDLAEPEETAPPETTPAETTTVTEASTSPETTSAPPETTVLTSPEVSASVTAEKEEIMVGGSGDMPLIIAAIALGAGIVGLIIYIIVTVNKYRS